MKWLREELWKRTPLFVLRVICFLRQHRWQELGETEVPVQLIKLDGTCEMQSRPFPHRVCRHCCWYEIKGVYGEHLTKEDIR